MILAEITINSVVHYISDEGFNDVHAWDAAIISFSPPQRQMSKKHGGMCAMSYGSIELSPDLFENDWPPPVANPIVIKHLADGETDETQAEEFFDGTTYLAAPGITAESIVGDLYAGTYDVDLLAEETDYNGNTVPLPMAIGTVTHVNPVRLADVTGKPTYHKGYIASAIIGTNWDVFDDGVNINANVTDNADGTFSLSATPVGEVTMSGIGSVTTLAELMAWGCGATYLNLTCNITKAKSPSPAVNFWAASQAVLVDFLTEICSFFKHLFYISGSTLYLVDLDEDNGSRTLTEYDYINAQYKYNAPIAIIRAKWQTREAVEETIGKYIKTIDHETTQASAYTYGQDMSVTPYHDAKANIDAALAAILTVLHKPYCEITIPMQGSLPVPGEKITWTDEQTRNDLTAIIRCRTITYDFDNDEVTIIGEGSISA